MSSWRESWENGWCRGPDSNRQAVKRRIFVTLRLSTPSASTRKANVRALDYAFAIAMRVLHAHRLRRPPSSLYTFRAFRPASAGKKTGLARRCLVARVWARAFRGFAEFEGFCTGRFRLGTQCFKSAMFTNFITPAGRTRFYHCAASCQNRARAFRRRWPGRSTSPRTSRIIGDGPFGPA